MHKSDQVMTIGLVAQNATAYIEKALACMSAGHIVVPLHSASDTLRIEVAGVEEVLAVNAGGGWLKPHCETRDADQVAQILFTSGTEGEPKGVVLTHGNLADVVTRLNSVMQVTERISEYVGVPVYYSFGFARCRAVANAGGRVYLPSQGFNPLEVNSLLESGEINAISAVPSLWRILVDSHVISQRAAARVKWIEIGSQLMTRLEKLALRKLFPDARIIQHYGLTEASRSTLLEVHTATDEQLESVGRTTGAIEVEIGVGSRVRIRGPNVARAVLRKGERSDPCNADGWLTTSDLGELRGGFLYFGGRADDVINCGGLKMPPDAIEERVHGLLGKTGEYCVCRIPDAVRGDGILFVVSPTFQATDSAILAAVTEACLEFNVNARGAIRIFRTDAFPRTATGKIQRNALAKQYTDTLPGEPHALEATTDATTGTHSLRQEMCRVLGISKLADTDSFNDRGGDSLRFIQGGMSVQRLLGYLPPAWERMPIAQLEGLPQRKYNWATIEAAVAARALGIMGVVINHSEILAGITTIDGAAFMLFIPMGYSFARFQLQRVLTQDRPWTALGALPRIMVPTFLLALAHQLGERRLFPSILGFYNNFVDHEMDAGFNFWFIEVFVQLQLILFALCALPSFRRLVRKKPYTASLILYIGGFAISKLMPMLWNSEHLYNLVPYRFIWYVGLGWCIYFGREKRQRLLNSALVAFLSAMQFQDRSQALWVFVAGQLMVWLPIIRLPKALASLTSIIASASLYIYLTHMSVFDLTGRLPIPYAAFLKIPIALCGGVILGWIIDVAWGSLGNLTSRRRE